MKLQLNMNMVLSALLVCGVSGFSLQTHATLGAPKCQELFSEMEKDISALSPSTKLMYYRSLLETPDQDFILLIGENQVIDFSPQAHRVLSEKLNSILSIQNGRIHFENTEIEAKFNELLKQGGGPLLVPGDRESSTLDIFVQPIPLMASASVGAPILILLKNTDQVSRWKNFAEKYKLNKNEINLAKNLIQIGETIESYSRKSYKAIETSRTHLSQLFSKTKTHRQSELMTLILNELHNPIEKIQKSEEILDLTQNLELKLRILETYLETRESAILFLDSSGKIQETTSTADRLLSEDLANAVRIENGHFDFTNLETQQQFQELMDSSLGDLKIPYSQGGKQKNMTLVLHPKKSYFMVTLQSTAPLVRWADFAIAYKITNAQLKLCEGLTEGLTLAEYAEVNNLSLGTVRSHLKDLFMKTSVHKQKDLVNLILNQFHK